MGLLPLLSLLAALAANWPLLGPAVLAQGQPIPLECRWAQGPWQACQMEVVDPGRHWFLVLGRRRFEFRHDGTGRMRLGLEGRWQDVSPRWGEDQSLCWGSLCARGEIPLD
jgi:hypothetical protein